MSSTMVLNRRGPTTSVEKGRLEGRFREADGDGEFRGAEDVGGRGMRRSGTTTAVEEEEVKTTTTDRSGMKKVAKCWRGRVVVLIHPCTPVSCNEPRKKGAFCHGW
jgi:hypothetical protein